jgi:hypothetical protein
LIPSNQQLSVLLVYPKSNRFLRFDTKSDLIDDYLEDLLQYVMVMLCVTVEKQPTIGILYAPFTDKLSKLIK